MRGFLEAVETRGLDLHGVQVVHRGRTIAQHWWAPYHPEARHVLYSLSKTFTALGALFAVQEGLLSLEDPVVRFFPRQAPQPALPHWPDVKVRHLLTMSLGMDADPTSTVTRERDWVSALLARPLDHPPGTRFVYNSLATYLAGAVVQAATGERLRDYLVPRFFTPLGIEDPPWDTCPRGRNTAGWGLYLTLDEVSRLGLFLLNRGAWEGRQLLSTDLVDQAVQSHITTGNNPLHDSHQGYGFQIWRCRHGAPRADGAFGQLCVVRPDLDLVVAVQAGVPDAQPVLDLIWEHVTPGRLLELPARPEGSKDPPPLGIPEGTAVAQYDPWNGCAWAPTGHPAGWSQVEFKEKGSQPRFWYRDDRGVHEVPFGWGRWTESRTTAWRHDSQKRRLFSNFASARWEGAARLALTLRFPEQAPVVTLTLTREGDSILLDQSLSVTMQASNFLGVRGTPCTP